MKKSLGTTNENLIGLVDFLRSESKAKKAPIWGDVAKRIGGPRRNRAEVNLNILNRNSKANDVIAIPGKLLGSGAIGHKVTVAALSFSSKAQKKITESGGKCLSFNELVNKNPKGTNVLILK